MSKRESTYVCQTCGMPIQYLGAKKYKHVAKGTGCGSPPVPILREVYIRQRAPLAQRLF